MMLLYKMVHGMISLIVLLCSPECVEKASSDQHPFLKFLSAMDAHLERHAA